MMFKDTASSKEKFARAKRVLVGIVGLLVIAMFTIAATQPTTAGPNTGDPADAAIDGLGGGPTFTGDTEDAGPGPDSSREGSSAGDPGEGSSYEGDDSDDTAADDTASTRVNSTADTTDDAGNTENIVRTVVGV